MREKTPEMERVSFEGKIAARGMRLCEGLTQCFQRRDFTCELSPQRARGWHGVFSLSVPLVSAVVVTRLQGLQVRAYSFLYHFRKRITGVSKCRYESTMRRPTLPLTRLKEQVNFHEWIGNGWAILFSHTPKISRPSARPNPGYMAGLQPEFAKRNCKIIGLSVDPVTNHGKWAADIEETQGHKVTYPMIGDPGST